MNGGYGPLSYAKNSSYQGGVLESAKVIIEEEITTKLDISTNSFCIADFGCSTGNNSFPAMHTIIEAIKRKHESSDLKTPEFLVFLNDVVSNDFNTLFRSLPPHRDYNVAAVPGDFHGRLLPRSSINFGYSSWSLHWLTEVPKAVADRDSPAWNGGEIFYCRERREVYEAYLRQFERDLETFLKCRAVEMVEGGIMALLIPGVPEFWDPRKEFTVVSTVELLRSSLVDMSKKGRLSDSKLESLNFPHYFPTPQELSAILQKSLNFSIQRMEILKTETFLNAQGHASCFRAVHQTMLTHHLGAEIMDELFDSYEKKLAASLAFAKPDNDRTLVHIAILKRKIV
ncbi:loganic acid O-methyltransferase-like [Salvia splendens]|nr:loganic acid O-methyltransferase-like [Salvia splendens]